jgi:cobalt-zinc-cadmium resistance protein CzcA
MVALSIPICALVAVIFMSLNGISANLMSLGGIAIAIGMLGDGAIVMVENIYRHLNSDEHRSADKNTIILAAAREVARPILFSIGIIITVFLPIFTLEGVEGKMFSPMAFTIAFALLGSIVTALLLSPVLSSYLLKRGSSKELAVMKWLKSVYSPLLECALKAKSFVIVIAIVAFAISMILLTQVGTEFIPTLEEGSILIGTVMAPSISLDKATETIMKVEKHIIENYPEVHQSVSRIGRPEAGSHPHPVNYAEVHLDLTPIREWKRFGNKQELIAALSEDLSSWPGVQFNFTQPIQNAFDELLSGIKAELAIKVFGEDIDVLREKANEIGQAIEDVPGLVDLSVEQSFGQPQIQIIPDRTACSRYGISFSQIQEIVELAIGGEVIDNLYLNTRRYGIHVRFKEEFRVDPDSISNILVHTKDDTLVPLSHVARVKQVIGPIQINREKNQRRWIVQGNVRGRDMGSVIADIQQRIREKVNIPAGCFIEFGGQFENQQRAMTRLSIIVPIMIAVVFIMLWLSFNSIRYAMIIIVNVPLALIGGVLGLFITGEYLSVPASVGFIALFGIAVQNGVVLVSYIHELREQGYSLHDALLQGGLLRLRPVLMTAITTILGLLPLLLSQGIGSEVQRPLAVVVVFGLTSSTLLTLFVIPVVFGFFEKKPEISEIINPK